MTAIIGRRRVDGRFPPVVKGLYIERMQLVIRDFASVLRSFTRPAFGRPSVKGTSLISGGRRWRTGGPTVQSLRSLGVQTAKRVVDVWREAGLDPFLTGRELDSVGIGLPLDEREPASIALHALGQEPGWFVRWHHGSRTGITTLGQRRAPRKLRRASRWEVFRALDRGGILVGPEQAVSVSFWQIGASGQREMVGQRGLDRFPADSPSVIESLDGLEFPGRAAFPYQWSAERMVNAIDVVYTWVDGSDSNWRAAFSEWAGRVAAGTPSHGLAPGRYRDNGELRYSLRSLHTNADWIRHVWVVTAGQTPEWLVPDNRLTVVDHSEILDPRFLPTFNSHVIESALHRIPGLAEHFIYLNDDMFFGRSIDPARIFTSGGLPFVFASRGRVLLSEEPEALAVDTAARNGRRLLQERLGRTVTFKPLHAPYALRRTTMDDLEKEFAAEFETTRAARFRSPTDLSTAASMGLHYGLITGRAVLGEITNEYVNLESARLTWHLDRLLRSRRFETFCVNETELSSDDGDRSVQRATEFFDSYFPTPSPWEL